MPGRRPFLLANPGSLAHENGVYPRALTEPVTWSTYSDWDNNITSQENVNHSSNIQLDSPGFSDTFDDGTLAPEYSITNNSQYVTESGGTLTVEGGASLVRAASMAYGWWEWEIDGHSREQYFYPIVSDLGSSSNLYNDESGYAIRVAPDVDRIVAYRYDNGYSEVLLSIRNVALSGANGTAQGTLRVERDSSDTFTVIWDGANDNREGTFTDSTYTTSTYQGVKDLGNYAGSYTVDVHRWEASGSGYSESGSFTLEPHQFVAPVAPELSADYSLQGGSIDLTLTGSPSGNSEVKTVSLDGSSTYNPGWNNTHSVIQVAADLTASSDGSNTPVLDSVTLTP